MVLKAKRILSPGTQIAGYRIEAELGQGAMAVVYRAVQLNLDRRVALKILSDELAANQEFVGRFFNEARAAAALSHAHIVQAYDAGVSENNIYYFAMEYVEGETLQQRIRRQGYVRPGPGIDLAIDIADALNYGWQRQHLTHGDIKPENIMINQAEESKLADFGLAKVAGHDFDGSDIMLTPLYAAPEMIRGEHAKGDCRADIYSFGATLYHMFGGTPPFPGEKAQEVMQRHLTEPLEPLRQRNPAVPRRISDLVGALLAKDPAQRPGDWESVLASLREIRRVLTEPPAQKVATASAVQLKMRDVRKAKAVAAAPGRRRRSHAWAVVMVLVLAAAAGAVLAGRHYGIRLPWPGRVVAPPSEPDAPPGGAAQAQGPAAGPSAAEEWATLRAEAGKADDPARALARLEEFARRHGTELPADYQTVLAACQVAVQAQKAAPAAGSDGRPTPPTPGVPGEQLKPPAATGAGLVAAPGVSVAPEKSPAQAAGPAERGTAPREGATPPAPDAILTDRLVVPMTPADRRADAFLGYMGQLARLEYAMPFRVENHVEAGQRWLLEYGDDSAERAQVAFCVSTALPALDEVVAKLAANTEILAGVKLPQREYSRCTVRDVSLAGLVLQEHTQHGVMLRNVAWQRLENPVGVLLHLSRMVAARSTNWRDRRPFLALILFTRNGKLFEEAVTGLPETPEKAEWEAVRSTLTKAADDGKALRLWERAVEACQQGERAAAYRLLTEVQATRSAVSERYGARIEQLLGVLGTTVPDVAGGRLVRKAAEVANEDPAAALATLLLVGARYGDVDFPEKARMDRLRQTALAAMPLPEWLQQPARRFPQQVIVPFAQPPSAGVPTLAMRTYMVAAETVSELGPRAAEMVPLLEGPALVELGDWSAASRALAKVTDSAIGALPPATRAAACYSRALVEARYGAGAARNVLETLRLCARAQADSGAEGQFALLPQILALEYGLCERTGEPDIQPYVFTADGLSVRGPVEPRARLILDLAALAMDRHQAGILPRLVPAVFGQSVAASDWGLSDSDVLMARLPLAGSREAAALAGVMTEVPARDVSEGHLRVAVTAALVREALDDAAWLKATEWTDLKGSTFGPVGGTAIYDLVLLRAAALLAAGNDAGALETVTWALEQNHPCLAPYYARLLFVRWGVLRLHGGGGSRELSEQVEAAACASRLEKALARLYVSEGLRAKARETVRESPDGRFWFEWLVTCERLGRQGAEAAGERFASARLPRSEQALSAALAGRAKRQEAGAGRAAAGGVAPAP